jgi:PDZ domain-containing protein
VSTNDTAPGPAGPAPSARRTRVGLLAALAALAGVAIVATSIRLPYYAISPGNAVATASLVSVEGAPSYRPDGSVYLTTVSLQQVTPLQAALGWLDPETDVVKEAVVVPRQVGRDGLRQFNLQQMDTSKEQALGVAFEHLGYDVVKGDGAEVVDVRPGTPADGKLSTGDVVVAVDDQPVARHDQLVRAVAAHHPGDGLRLSVVAPAGGEARTVEVTVGAHPADASRAFLGVVLRTRNIRFQFPFDVKIGSDRIGGPSAGLAFTLEVLDLLTPGELTGGRRVAATGTIELDGSVGDVGGVAQKTAAVRAAGIKLFLVPRGEYEEARRRAGSGVRVEAVDNLDDALRVLASVGGNGLALGRPAAAPEPR